MQKTAIIKKLPNGKYRLYSRKKDNDGKRKNLGTYDSRSEAEERERQINYFKHNVDDSKALDRETRMLLDLSDIAKYLEESGMVEKAEQVYIVMNTIDAVAPSRFDTNSENQGYVGGPNPIGGYSPFDIGVGQPNIDHAVRSNGLQGNTLLNGQNSSMTPIFSDSYFYTGYSQLDER